MARQADVSLLIEPDAGLSYRFAAPNKLFQYLFAGAIAVVSDIPEQRAVVGDGAGGSSRPPLMLLTSWRPLS